MATGTAVDVVMPQMGVSVSEGTVTKWLKSEGEQVAADEPLLEISTDKVDTELPSPASGTLGRILVAEGETVPVGTAIALIVADGGGLPEPHGVSAETAGLAPTPEGLAPGAPAAAPVAPPPAVSVASAPTAETAPPTRDEIGRRGTARAFVSPVVARIAAEHGVDVSVIPGTGRGGRVTKNDMLAHIERARTSPAVAPSPAQEAAPAPPPPVPVPPPPPTTVPLFEPAPPEPLQPQPEAPPAPPLHARPPAAAPADAARIEAGSGETIERMTVMRRSIAEHMRRSLETSARVTTVFEVDMSKVSAIREKLKAEFEQRHGVRLTYLAFIARAVVDALANWPWMNAEIRGDSIVVKSYVNLGVAVALDGGKGLIVPVVRNAEEKSLLGMARAIADLAERARAKKLSPDEVQDGTFTITNPGGFGAIMGTPIINQPQVAILDVEAIVKRPVVLEDDLGNDTIAIRPMMNLCLTFDHRLIDGAYAAPFMRDLKINLETWDLERY